MLVYLPDYDPPEATSVPYLPGFPRLLGQFFAGGKMGDKCLMNQWEKSLEMMLCSRPHFTDDESEAQADGK